MIILKCFIILFSYLHINFAYANEIKIQERIKNFKSSKEAMKKINESIRKKNYSSLNDQILFLYNWFIILPSYFPEGTESSIKNNSDASANIWENFTMFQNYSNNSKNISLKILNSINKNDIKDVERNIDQLARSCSTCHKKFRN